MSRFAALPKGVSEEAFARAINEYRGILGENRVRTDAATLQGYLATAGLAREEEHRPSAALYPATVKEIQSIVAIANKHRTPLWTVCNGENEGYALTAPATRGQIVLDLRNMKKIIEVDQELGYCLVEPGVTYGELQQYLKQRNINLWLDAPANSASMSVAGNILERGAGYTPYSEHFLFSCGMEVVLADGSVLKTGMGGIHNTTSWQVFKWGFGPYVDGIFSQANNGIVTKIGTWLMGPPPPGGYLPFCLRLPRTEMVGELFKPLMFLRQTQIVPNACAVVSAAWENADRQALRAGGKAPAWSVYGAVYGSPEQVALNWMYVSGTFQQAFGKKVQLVTEKEAKNDPVFQYRKQLMMGGITQHPAAGTGSAGFLQFTPTAAARPAECRAQAALASDIVRRHGFEYVSEFIVGWRDARHVINLKADRAKPEQVKKAHQCYDELLSAFTRRGWAVTRTNPAHMDKVADSYGAAMRRLNRTIKKALDPNNILSPGKAGINLGA